MPTLETAYRNVLATAAGTVFNSGTIELQTSGGVEVATNTFGATAFGSPSTGVITANAIGDDTSATGGTVGKAVFKISGGTVYMTCTVGVSENEVQLTNLTIGAGDIVSYTSLTITVPAS